MIRALLALFAAACLVDPSPDTRAAPRPAWPALYADLWTRCGSTIATRPTVRYADLRWHRMPGESFRWGGKLVIGAWLGRDIYLTSSLWEWDPLVRHEMLHAQLGEIGHPPIFQTCAGVA